MILNCSEYSGYCTECGHVHNVDTKLVVVDHGCVNLLDMYLEGAGLRGRRAVIYDSNTKKLPGVQNIKADIEIVLEAEGLHSELKLLEETVVKMQSPDCIVAVGGGTIMDFARYAAHKLEVPFVAVPTLLSADGYTAQICSVMVDGQKKSIPMVAPVMVLADIDIIKGAPRATLLSGIADIISKYVSLADWQVAAILSDEIYCERIAAITYRALQLMMQASMKMASGEEPDYTNMTMSLMISGLTMQMHGSSRPASGAEHLVAHMVEMHPVGFENAEGLHGECVGVGTLLISEYYHKMLSVTPTAKPYEPLDEAWIREKFGALADGILAEHEKDVVASVRPEVVVFNWEEISHIIKTIPTPEMFTELFSALGMKHKLSDIGVDDALRADTFKMAPYVRNRLTLAKLAKVLDFGGAV